VTSIDKKRIVILSVPYQEPFPSAAPMVLTSCLKSAGISSIAIDFNINFLYEFFAKPYWPEFRAQITLGVKSSSFKFRALVDILKFIRKQLREIKQNHDPEYIGLSLFTHESIDFSYILIYCIRRYLPSVKIIVGGRALELKDLRQEFYYNSFYNNGLADVVVVGDAEYSIVKVINENITGVYVSTPLTHNELNSLPMPDWSDYNLSLYSDYQFTGGSVSDNFEQKFISVTASKGCVRKCTFCDVESFWPKFVYRDGDSVAQEIISHYRQTGITRFKFTDNLINGSISEYRKMNKVLAETIPNTIEYSGFAIFRSASQQDKDDFKLARLAGCKQLQIGVESGSERVRYHMKKKFSNDDMDFSVQELHKNKIQQIWLMMVGYPTETDWDYLESERLFRRYQHLRDLIVIDITATFQLNDNAPLITNEKLRDSLHFKFDRDDNFSRFFWVSADNPDNTFPVRYERYKRLSSLSLDLGYRHGGNIPRILEELEKINTVYNETKHKKIFPISRV
jgi:hypothetical protein